MAGVNSSTTEEDHDKKMKQSLRRSRACAFQLRSMSKCTADELVVAATLLEMPQLCSLSERRFFPCWTSKRRRSALTNPPMSSSPLPQKEALPAPPPPPASIVSDSSKPEINSPNTPLDFCPSDLDAKSNQSTKSNTSLQSSEDEWLHKVNEATQIQDSVKKEIGHMNPRKRKLQKENSDLKAKKQQHKSTVRGKKKTQLEVCEGLSNPVTECPQQHQTQLQPTVVNNDNVLPSPSTSTMIHPHPSFIPLQPINGYHLMAQEAQIYHNNQYQQGGPPTIDLNLPATADEMVTPEQFQPLDHHHRFVIEMNQMIMMRKHRAAAARQHRIQKIKLKKARRGTS